MRRYVIEFSTEARDAIQAHVDYVAFDLRSPENAGRWLRRLMDTIGSLAELPTRFAIDDEQSELLDTRVHRLVFERSCVLLYDVDEAQSRVRVFSFRYGGFA